MVKICTKCKRYMLSEMFEDDSDVCNVCRHRETHRVCYMCGFLLQISMMAKKTKVERRNYCKRCRANYVKKRYHEKKNK